MTTANLTIQDNDTVVQYTSIGESAFAFPFPITNQDQLAVSIDQVDQVIGTDYTVSGVGNAGGGTVTFLVATNAGELVTIWVDMPIKRLTGFALGAATLLPEDLNAEFIQQTRVTQMLRRDIRRSLRIPPDDPDSGQNMEIPVQGTRAGKFLAFDALGRPTVSVGSGGGDTSLRTDLAATSGGSLLGYIHTAAGAIARTLADKALEHVTPQDFNAAGDGTTDDTAAWLAAIAASAEVIDGQGKSYRVDTTVAHAVTAGMRKAVINAHFVFSNNAILNDRLFDFTGSLGSGEVVAAVTAGDSTITVADGSAFSEGQQVKLKSLDNWGVGAGESRGEWLRIRSIAGNVLTFEQKIRLSYATNPTLYSPVMGDWLIFDNVTAEGSGDAFDQWLCSAEFFENTYFNRVIGKAFAAYNLVTQHCVNNQFGPCSFLGGDWATGLAYGIVVTSCNSTRFDNIYGQGLRHILSVGGQAGIAWNTVANNIVGEGLTEAIVDCHPGTAWFTANNINGSFRGNQGSSEGDGIVLQGAYCQVSNVLLDGPERHGVLVQPSTVAVDDFCVAHNVTCLHHGSGTAGSAAAFSVSPDKPGGNIRLIDLEGVAYSTESGSKGFVLNAGSNHADGLIEMVRVNVLSSSEDACIETQTGNPYTITNLILKGSVKRQNTTGEAILLAAPGAGDITTVMCDLDIIEGGSTSIRNVNVANVLSVRGIIRRVTGYGTGGPGTGTLRVKLAEFQETATGSFVCYQEGVTVINSSAGAVSATLAAGQYIGQRKVVVMNEASNSSTLTVANHSTSSPEVFTYADVDDYLELVWAANHWKTALNSGVTT